MQENGYITVISDRKEVVLNTLSVMYLLTSDKNIEIHVIGGAVYKTRMSLSLLEQRLGDDFIKVHRGCIVAVRAIHDITDTINLSNGEKLEYTKRKKREIIRQFQEKQMKSVLSAKGEGEPSNEEEYRRHYACFDNLPIAFTDIEMVYDEDNRAIDWIFRYGNQALAELENHTLEELIGNSFKTVFPDMDEKWLKSYERTALYEETLEVIDYSSEVDKNLKVICFPTFKGHCGCILLDLSQLDTVANIIDTRKK